MTLQITAKRGPSLNLQKIASSNKGLDGHQNLLKVDTQASKIKARGMNLMSILPAVAISVREKLWNQFLNKR